MLDSDKGARADTWHTDVTFSATPPMASILSMVVCPERGGDTLWTNQYLAYETLSDPIRELVDGLTAVHHAAPFGRPEIRAEHPAVRIHPETGRRALYVNRTFTSHFKELRRSESDALLRMLCDWSEQPAFQVRYRWSKGAIGIWDNRCTMHFAINDYDETRVIQRVTVLGDAPRGGKPRWPAFRSDQYSAGSGVATAGPRAGSRRIRARTRSRSPAGARFPAGRTYAHPAALCFESLHDLRMVRPSAVPQRAAPARDPRQLGYRLLRILSRRARQPLRAERLLGGGAEDDAGGDHPRRLRALLVAVPERAAALEPRARVPAHHGRCGGRLRRAGGIGLRRVPPRVRVERCPVGAAAACIVAPVEPKTMQAHHELRRLGPSRGSAPERAAAVETTRWDSCSYIGRRGGRSSAPDRARRRRCPGAPRASPRDRRYRIPSPRRRRTRRSGACPPPRTRTTPSISGASASLRAIARSPSTASTRTRSVRPCLSARRFALIEAARSMKRA